MRSDRRRSNIVRHLGALPMSYVRAFGDTRGPPGPTEPSIVARDGHSLGRLILVGSRSTPNAAA